MFGKISTILFMIIVLYTSPAYAEVDDLTASMRISASGIRAQNERLKVIAQNIANADVTGKSPGENPYRRKTIYFKNEYDDSKKTNVVMVDKIGTDQSDFILKYEPNHPAADENGYVKYPNVNTILETVDAKEAQRSFEANINALEIAKTNQYKLIELMK